MKPTRIILSRQRGYRLPANTIKVDRSTRWGNPWRVGQAVDMKLAAKWGWEIDDPSFVCESAQIAAARFFSRLMADEASIAEAREHLAGRNLACWCKDIHCHVTGLMIVANTTPETIKDLRAYIAEEADAPPLH